MKLNFIKIAGVLCLLTTAMSQVNAQGCVAIRSGCGANVGGGNLLQKGQFIVSTNMRYFHSFRHFRGRTEETYRVQEGSQVENKSYFNDVVVNYGITNRLSFVLDIPYIHNTRSSEYEHGGNPKADDPSTPENEYWAGDRHTTRSSGIGDIRLGFNYWLIDPVKATKTNFSIGLGMKLNNGNYRVQDKFYNQGPNKDQVITSGVDQSIQLGDGGVGITLNVQGYHALTNTISLTTSLYYMSNLREQYTLEARGSTRQYSSPDQYAARLGALIMLPIHGLYLYGGGRLEGVPSSDLIGGDKGFRRPGYVISAEPGLGYAIRNLSVNLSVPIATQRNRTKSYSDKLSGRHGDASFANYLINFGISYRIGKKPSAPIFNNTQPLPIKTN